MKTHLASLLGLAALAAFAALPFRSVVGPAPAAQAHAVARVTESRAAARAAAPLKQYSLRRMVPRGAL